MTLGNRFSNDYGINYRTGNLKLHTKLEISSKKNGNFMNGPQDGGMWLLLRNRLLKSKEKALLGGNMPSRSPWTLREHKDFECECSCTLTSFSTLIETLYRRSYSMI